MVDLWTEALGERRKAESTPFRIELFRAGSSLTRSTSDNENTEIS